MKAKYKTRDYIGFGIYWLVCGGMMIGYFNAAYHLSNLLEA